MKRVLTILAVALLVALAVPTLAFASTKQEEEICAKAKSYEKVSAAQCIVYKDICMLAIKTEKFTTKTEYDSFKNQLQTELKKQFGLDKVIVSRSPRLMHTLNKLAAMSETEREQAIENFFDIEFGGRIPPKPQPRTQHEG